MANEAAKICMIWKRSQLVLLGLCLCGGSATTLAETAPTIAPLPRQCQIAEGTPIAASPLPNVAAALKERRKITILAIGSTSASLRGVKSASHYSIIERLMESTFKGLDVAIIHRGVSGELAHDAAERMKAEVALTGADLVLWQLGTADALAQVPIDEFSTTITDALTWLKEHHVDVILIGLRYARSLAHDAHYQATRLAVQEIAREQNVLRIGRYEAEETIEKFHRAENAEVSEAEVTEASYACMAEYLARAIVAGLFARSPLPAKKM
jgi:acyl-CoA thioesterase-1